MKKEWSRSWVQSVQPSKQRKYRFNAPAHVKQKFMSCYLSKELRRQYGKRSLVVRKGDQIEIMRGSSAGLRGTVEQVNPKKDRVYVEGIIVKKVDGSEVKIGIRPSNLKITKLNLDDKARLKSLNRSGNNKKDAKPELKKKDTKPEGKNKPKEAEKKEEGEAKKTGRKKEDHTDNESEVKNSQKPAMEKTEVE